MAKAIHSLANPALVRSPSRRHTPNSVQGSPFYELATMASYFGLYSLYSELYCSDSEANIQLNPPRKWMDQWSANKYYKWMQGSDGLVLFFP